jgi:hypothetical protein
MATAEVHQQNQQLAMEDFQREKTVGHFEDAVGGGGSAGGAMRAAPDYAKAPYSNAPDSLMGFRKQGPQKGYDETNYKYELPVRVTYPDKDVFEDGIKGLNKAHALERARRNWPGATVEPLN